jgi:ABC-type nitrate/sulfonate/bicarbonate transport system substrate-binding protein
MRLIWCPVTPHTAAKPEPVLSEILSVIAFVGPETLPLQVASEQGFFADQRLDVQWTAATGSVDQMTRLMDGRCDIVMTAIDNVIAYVEGQGAVIPDTSPDLVAFLGCASEPRPLVARPDIGTIADLRDQRIAVDALNTGFSFLLRHCLETAGLGRTDYDLVPVGAPPARWQAMESGDCVAALLSKAYAETATAAGYHELRPEPDPWKTYQGGVFAARKSWLRDRPAVASGFIRAMLEATDWMLEPSQAPTLPDMLIRHLPHLSISGARAAATALPTLLQPGLPISGDGLQTVLALRQNYGKPATVLGDANKYLDMRLYAEVT